MFKKLICLVLTLPAIALAQSVSVSVNATTVVRTVDERIFGINAVIWDPLASSDQTIALLQAAGLRTIRVPGGSLSDEYHWRTNTSLANTWTWATSFNGFGKLITGLNAHAFVAVNYGTGTPEEAAALVAYANAATGSTVSIGTDAKGYNWQTAGTWASVRAATALGTDDGMNFLRVGRAAGYGYKYWEIGNENYGTWETDEQAVKNDAYTYATRAKDYIAKMKAVDSSIKVGVVVTSRDDDYVNGHTSHPATNLRTGTTTNGWTPVVLATLRSLNVTPDFIIYHRYEQAPAADQPNNPETDAGLLQKAKTWPDDVASMRRMLADYLGPAGAGVEIVVTENNSVYAGTGKQTTSLVNGLYLADSVANLLQTEINALMWWDTRNGTVFNANNSSSLYGWRNYGDYGILSSQVAGGPATSYEPYPTYYALKLLSKFARQGDTVVSATSNNSLLSVFAAKTTGGNLNLLVINKDPSATLNASIAVAGYTVPAAANVHSYGKPQDDAAKPGGSGSTDIASTTMAISGGTFTASFASYSMTVISLDTTATPPTPVVTPPPTPTPTPTPTPAPSSGGGGGGGAPSLWFISALALLALARKAIRR
jgi:alpha-N-arabinofuranosidase